MGRLVEQSIKTLYQGVSRQPDSVRLAGQVEEATNVLMSVVTGGFETRPASRHVAENTFVTSAADKPWVYSYARDTAEKYIIVVKNGDLKIYDTDGVEKTCTFPDGKTYLNTTDPSVTFSAATIADRTIIASNAVVPAMTASTYSESPARGLINCRTTNSATAYSISIDGSSVWTYSGAAKSATEIADNIVANISLPTGVTMTRDDLTLVLSKSTAFTLTQTGSDDTYGPLAIRQTVPKRTHLPASAPDGYLVNVGATIDGNASGYWSVFSTSTNTWTEAADPGANNAFTASTMPHWLTRQANGTFVFEEGSYVSRIAGDAVTSPEPDFIGFPINEIVFHRNRLAFVSGEHVTFSQSSNYFTFWSDFSTEALDSDSFSVTASSTSVNKLTNAHAFRKALFVSSDKNQFEVSGEEVLTPSKASIDLTTTYLAEPNCQPFNLGNTLYFAAKSGRDAVVYEYQYSDDTLSNKAADITLHALGYVPAPVVKMTGDPSSDMLFLISNKDRSRIYLYRMYIDGDKKAQSAWHCWDYGGATTHVHWIEVIEGDLYMLITRGSKTFLERSVLRYETSDEKHPYQVALDQQTNVTGSYNAGTNLTTWTTPYPHGSAATVVLSTDFAVGQQGERLTVSYPSTTTITATGDYSAGASIIGVPFDQTVQLSKIYVREAANQAETITTGRYQLRRVQVNYQNTGNFNVNVTPRFRDPMSFNFSGRIIGAGENLVGTTAISGVGTFKIPVQTDAATAVLEIKNSTEKPMTITSIDFVGFFNELSRAE